MRIGLLPQTWAVSEIKDDEKDEITGRTLVLIEHLTLPNGQMGPELVAVEIGPYPNDAWAAFLEFINDPNGVAARHEAASRIVTPGGPLR